MQGGFRPRIRGMRQAARAGFTITEVLIVMAVTSLLFISAAALISGKQSQTEFDQGIQQVQSQIQLIINEVASGYYPNAADFSCQRGGTGPSFLAGSNAQGTNTDCIFLGKIIEFGSGVAGTEPEKVAVHSLAGLRTDSGGIEILVLKDSVPTVIPGSTLTFPLQGSITTTSMSYNSGVKSVGAVAIVSSLGQLASNSLPVPPGSQPLLSGSQHLDLIPIDGTALTQDQATLKAIANTFLQSSGVTINPVNGVQVCFASAGTNQSGLLTLGNNGTGGRELQAVMDIKTGKVC